MNTGVVAWPDEDSAWSTVRRMQLELHRWASEEDGSPVRNGVMFTDASSVAVSRYRYRGANIPTPDPHRQQRLSNGQDTWRAGCVETRTSGSAGGHGKRTRGNPDTAPVPDLTAAAG